MRRERHGDILTWERLHAWDYRTGLGNVGVCLEWLNLITSLYSFLYSVALAVAMLVSLPYWLFQMARHGKYSKGLAERLGRLPSRLQLPKEQELVIWVHAVSVGEVLAVAGLVEELRQRFPQHRIFISTTTDTRAGACAQTLRRRERILLSYGFRIRDPALPAGAAAANGGDCGD